MVIVMHAAGTALLEPDEVHADRAETCGVAQRTGMPDERGDVAPDETAADDERFLTSQIRRHFGTPQRRPLRALLSGPPVRKTPCEREQAGDRSHRDRLGLRARAGSQAHAALQVRLIVP